MTNGIQTLSDTGKGRTFVLLHEGGTSREFAEKLSVALSRSARVFNLECELITDSNWPDLTTQLSAILANVPVKQASFVAFGAAGALAMNLALADLRLVRAMVLVDCASRAHPTWLNRFIDRVEHMLPLGLPLRLKSKGFDAMPFLQRLRFPVLVVNSKDVGDYLRGQSEQLTAGLPTAWRIELGAADPVTQLVESVLKFQDVPAKCPQKNLAA